MFIHSDRVECDDNGLKNKICVLFYEIKATFEMSLSLLFKDFDQIKMQRRDFLSCFGNIQFLKEKLVTIFIKHPSIMNSEHNYNAFLCAYSAV